jgi:hypothetical protein
MIIPESSVICAVDAAGAAGTVPDGNRPSNYSRSRTSVNGFAMPHHVYVKPACPKTLSDLHVDRFNYFNNIGCKQLPGRL